MSDPHAYFITWTTYGTWLPGDPRGWRRRENGSMEPQPRLETWCKNRMEAEPVLLRDADREAVRQACHAHAQIRGWNILAVYVGVNHVHVVVEANEAPQKVRDQLKANCTRTLRSAPTPLIVEKTWTKGGDCAVLWKEDEVSAAVEYVVEGQRKTPSG